MLKLVTLMTRGLIVETRSRRWAMFILLLAAMLMLFAGATFLAAPLMAGPLAFLIYWAICAWLTLAALLLALWDLLMVRAAARQERRKLEREYIERHEHEDGP